MTTQEIFNQFSDVLLHDERILSAGERELLLRVLQNAGRDSTLRQSDRATSEAISRAVGETVAQRAFTVLGSHIVSRMLDADPSSPSPNPDHRFAMGPTPPAKGPTPPTQQPTPPSKGPTPPTQSPITPAKGPTPPSAQAQATRVAVMDEKAFLPARYASFEEFLVPEELDRLTKHALDHAADFQISEVISPGVNAQMVDYDARRSRVLMNQDAETAVLTRRIQAFLPRILQKLGQESFSVTQVEAQITASNHGDFFYCHTDNGTQETSARALTFVYFFHREPKSFRGGELLIYDSQRVNGDWMRADTYQTIVPEQNRIVFFPSSLVHEITPVDCPSEAFADSRFTVNGWFRR